MELLTRTADPVKAAVTLEEAKEHLQITGNDEDGYIYALTKAATQYFDVPDGLINRALITQTWKVSVSKAENNCIYLPVTPIQSVSSIDYYDTDDVSQSLTVGDFWLIANSGKAYITPKNGVSWPSTSTRADAISVTFVAGYGDDESDVPDLIRQAVLLTVRHWFDNRSATSDYAIREVPMAIESIVNIYRKGWVG